jgi:hypothetical protein
MAARRGVLVVVVATMLLTACRVDTTVGVDLHRDGSGLVRVHLAFDDEAARRVPIATIKLDDLQAAGWRVSRDATSITMEKAFARPAELGPTVRELTGTGGLASGVSATRTSSFFRTHVAVRLDVDLRPLAVGLLADRDLVNGLRLVGVDPVALELKLDAPVSDAVAVRLLVALPDGRVRSWTVTPGGHVDARATASVANGGRWSWLIAALALAGAAVVLLGVSWLLPGRRRTRGSDVEATAPDEAPADSVEPAPETVEPAPETVEPAPSGSETPAPETPAPESPAPEPAAPEQAAAEGAPRAPGPAAPEQAAAEGGSAGEASP